jgi:hypothetical protein
LKKVYNFENDILRTIKARKNYVNKIHGLEGVNTTTRVENHITTYFDNILKILEYHSFEIDRSLLKIKEELKSITNVIKNYQDVKEKQVKVD